MKYIRIVSGLFFLLVVLWFGGKSLVEWSLERSFEAATKPGGGVHQVAGQIEASLGRTLARGDIKSRLEKSSADAKSESVLSYYYKNPREVERDKKYFVTWLSALAVVEFSLNTEKPKERWESSKEAEWIAPEHRIDAWGHAFCISVDASHVIVISPGAQASSSLDCSSLKLSEEKILRIPRARLVTSDSGLLILLVDK